jgi:hypothetical protein
MYRTLTTVVLIVACFVTNGCGNKPRTPSQEPESAQAALVGDWLEQQYLSPEYIDGLKEETPEADREVDLARLNEFLRTPQGTLRLHADGTCEILGTAKEPSDKKGETWTLAEDGRHVTIELLSPWYAIHKRADGDSPSVEWELQPATWNLVLSADGQTLSDPDASEHYGRRYLKAGSEAANIAFDDKPKG